jgi:hypothetical protein
VPPGDSETAAGAFWLVSAPGVARSGNKRIPDSLMAAAKQGPQAMRLAGRYPSPPCGSTMAGWWLARVPPRVVSQFEI